jgi:hypothetical protein
MVSTMVTVFWDVKPCNLVETAWHFKGAYCLHHQDLSPGWRKGSKHLWNVSQCLSDCTVQHPRRRPSLHLGWLPRTNQYYVNENHSQKILNVRYQYAKKSLNNTSVQHFPVITFELQAESYILSLVTTWESMYFQLYLCQTLMGRTQTSECKKADIGKNLFLLSLLATAHNDSQPVCYLYISWGLYHFYGLYNMHIIKCQLQITLNNMNV